MAKGLRARLRRRAAMARFMLMLKVKQHAGTAAVQALRAIRRANPDRSVEFGARWARRIGPFLPEHRIGRANLTAAYPEKSAAEIEQILRGVWDNIGRTAFEFAHLDRLWDFRPDHPAAGRLEPLPGSAAIVERLRDDGKPALIFCAHLANWEMPALAAAALGIESAALYRAPNLAAIDQEIRRIRANSMGVLIRQGIGAAITAARLLEKGSHVGMLVDQHFGKGVEVTFFGRRCLANPLLAMLARQVECPIHGIRIIRVANNRFHAEVTEAVPPVRDAEGKVDIQGTMQAVTNVVESWVREHPDQWLWLHRRWR